MKPTAKNKILFPLLLCLLAPTLLFSGIFSIFTPLPILYLHFLPHSVFASFLAWPLLSILIGTGLSILISWEEASIFFLVSAPTLAMGVLLKKKIRPEWAILASVLSAFVIVLICMGIFFHQGGEISAVKSQANIWLSEFANTLLETQNASFQEEKRKTLEEIVQQPEKILPLLPGPIFTMLLFFYTLPFIVLLSWNVQEFHKQVGVHRHFLREWRAPEFLLWPTILVAAALIFRIEPLEIIANNLFKIFLAIYFLQGLSVLASFLNRFRMKSPLHIPIYAVAILFLWPLLTGVGFFDLWFNFRKKRISKKPEA